MATSDPQRGGLVCVDPKAKMMDESCCDGLGFRTDGNNEMPGKEAHRIAIRRHSLLREARKHPKHDGCWARPRSSDAFPSCLKGRSSSFGGGANVSASLSQLDALA